MIKASTVKAGDGYQSVAASMLGKGATESDIAALASDLQSLNGNSPDIYANQELVSSQDIEKLLASDKALDQVFTNNEQAIEAQLGK